MTSVPEVFQSCCRYIPFTYKCKPALLLIEIVYILKIGHTHKVEIIL